MNFKGLGRIPPATCKYNIDTAEVYTGTCTVCTCSFNAFLQFFYVVVAYSLQLEYKSNIQVASFSGLLWFILYVSEVSITMIADGKVRK